MSIEKMLVISTSHIPQLVYMNVVAKMATMSRPEGDLFIDSDLEKIRDEHPNIDQICKMAYDQMCDWILFDRDGEIYKELPTFNW